MSRRTPAVLAAAAAIVCLAPATAGAATFTAFAGADGVSPGAPKQFTANAFLRKTLVVHVGDRVRWQFHGFHDVFFPAHGSAPPPLIVPDTSHPVTGALDGAGQPFWFNGLPSLTINPRVALPVGGTTVTGSRAVGSGLPLSPTFKSFTARFPKAGTFTYFCAVHPGMRGTVRVVSKRRRIPSKRADAHARQRELAALIRHAKRVAARPASTTTVQVGRQPRRERFSINAFFPAALTVKVGQTVRFSMAADGTQEPHTVTFGPPAVRDIEFVTPTGGLNPVGAYPSDPPPSLPPYDGTNHGNGFLNSGVIDNNPATPQPNTTFVTFTKPGTYTYECVIHAGMEGSVTVTP